jgi:uracil-DNA glycosylase family 4
VPLTPKPSACDGCTLHDRGVGFVPPTGPLTARVMILGQGPGDQEAYASRPFHEPAPSGGKLSRWINQAGGQRTDLMIANAIWCWKPKGTRNGLPFGNEEPTPGEIHQCAERHLAPLIARMPNLRRIIPVGTPAGRWALGVPAERNYERYVGTTVEKELPIE